MCDRGGKLGRERQTLAVALVVLAGVSCGCGQRIERARSTTPGGECTATIRDYFRNPFSIDGTVEVEVECRGGGVARYEGTNDWRYRSSAVRWDLKAQRVSVAVCGKISSPIYAEFGLEPVRLQHVNPKGLRHGGQATDGDLLLRSTCSAEVSP